MRLDTYLQKYDLTQEQFALLVGGTQSAVSQWISGQRCPRPKYLKIIVDVTKGRVTANDFMREEQC